MNKHIDEIAKLICTYPQCIHYNIIGGCENAQCQTVDFAEQLYKAGYRRQDEVAREILDTIYTILNTFYIDNHLNCFPAHFPEGLHPLGKLELAKSFGDALHLKLKELKKKYGVMEDAL